MRVSSFNRSEECKEIKCYYFLLFALFALLIEDNNPAHFGICDTIYRSQQHFDFSVSVV